MHNTGAPPPQRQYPPRGMLPPGPPTDLVNGHGNRPPTASHGMPPPMANGPVPYQGQQPRPPMPGGPQYRAPAPGMMQGGPQRPAPPSINYTPPTSNTSTNNRATPPGELPIPYHGHAQYSHQLRAPNLSDSPVTPNASEPPSQKSSRAPSPIPGTKYDALEGQFPSSFNPGSPQSPSLDVTQQPPLQQNQQNMTTMNAHQPPGSQPGQMPPPVSSMGQMHYQQGQSPPNTVPQPGKMPPPPVSQPGQMPPSMSQPGQMPPPPMSQAGQVLPPPMSQSGQVSSTPMSQQGQMPPMSQSRQMPPPPMSQTGQVPPPMSQPGQMPPMSQPGQMPPISQPGQMPPPPMSQAGGQVLPMSQPGQMPPHMSQLGGQMPPPPPMSQPGGQMPPPPMSQPGGQMPPPLPMSRPGGQMPPPPMSQPGGQMPPPPPMSQPGGQMPPPPMSQPGGQMPPPPMAQPGGQMPPPPTSHGGQVPTPTMSQPGQVNQQPTYNNQGYAGQSGTGSLNSSFNTQQLHQATNLSTINLLQETRLLPATGLDDVKPNLPNDYKKTMCSPDVFRCTLSTLPDTQSLLNKARLPLGILIHPFKDLSQLPVIQSNVIVRCRSCRTYINPYVTFVDMRRWKCNLCYRINELPEEFNFDPVSRTYGEPQRRPEVRSSTIEFIAPSEYMLRPPQPAVYMFILDVSFNAISSGYLELFCQTLLDELDNLPGDARTHIGFLTFDRSLHFYNLGDALTQPQMLVVSDVEDIFLPCPDSLLVNLQQSRDLIMDLLTQLPSMFENNKETGSALGPALQAAFKLMGSTGGRVTVMQTQLPTVGPGSLKSREDPNQRASGKVTNLGPATDFYKKLSLDCSAQQIAVDVFMLNSQYADVSSIACISKYSGGSVYYFSGLNNVACPGEAKRYEGTLRRYLTRKIGFEAVMRIRCTRGLSIHTFHGNFFVRSTDLLSLPNINPDAGFGMQMSIDDKLEGNNACFQAALLYTSSKGERRIRVHTMCLPITSQLSDVYAGADQKAIVGLLAKMAVDKSLSQSLSDARDAMMFAVVDMLNAYGSTQVTASARVGQLPVCFSLRVMPLFIMALMKYRSFRTGISTKLDDRVFALENCKTMPLHYLLLEIHPNFYPVHALDDQNAISKGDLVIPQPPLLQLSSGNMDRHGAYIMDSGTAMYLWLGGAINDQWVQDVFGVTNFSEVLDNQTELPELKNPTSERLRTFIQYLNDQRPYPASLTILREDSRSRQLFIQHLIEDRSESTMSYYEFLKYLQQEVKA